MGMVLKPSEPHTSFGRTLKNHQSPAVDSTSREPAWTSDPGGLCSTDFRKRQSLVQPSFRSTITTAGQLSHSSSNNPDAPMSKQRSSSRSDSSSRAFSRTNAIKLKPLSTVEEHDLYIHESVYDSYLDWCNDWTLLFEYTPADEPTAGDKPNALFNRYSKMLTLDKRSPLDRIRWRFYTMFFYDLHVLLNEHDNLTARGFETLFAALDLESSGTENADEVKRNLRSWIARGHRYRNLSTALGGSGILFLLPNKITEYLWEESLPLKGDAFEQAVQLLSDFSITEKATEAGANDLGAKIEQGLLDPFRWNTQMSTSGSVTRRPSQLSLSRSSSRSRSSTSGPPGGSNLVFSASTTQLSHLNQQRQPLQRNASQPIVPSQRVATTQGESWGSMQFLASLSEASDATATGALSMQQQQALSFQPPSRSSSRLGRGRSQRRLTPGEMTPFMSSARVSTPTPQQTYQPMQAAAHPESQLYGYMPTYVPPPNPQQHPHAEGQAYAVTSMADMDMNFAAAHAHPTNPSSEFYTHIPFNDPTDMTLDMGALYNQPSGAADSFNLTAAHGAAGLYDQASSYNYNISEQHFTQQQGECSQQQQHHPHHPQQHGQQQQRHHNYQQHQNWRQQ